MTDTDVDPNQNPNPNPLSQLREAFVEIIDAKIAENNEAWNEVIGQLAQQFDMALAEMQKFVVERTSGVDREVFAERVNAFWDRAVALEASRARHPSNTGTGASELYDQDTEEEDDDELTPEPESEPSTPKPKPKRKRST